MTVFAFLAGLVVGAVVTRGAYNRLEGRPTEQWYRPWARDFWRTWE